MNQPRSSPRVLFVLESVFPKRGGGGAEAQVLTLARKMRSIGIDVAVIAPMVPDGPQQAADEVGGVPVQRISYPKIPVIGAALMLLRLMQTLIRERRNTVAIHAHIAHNMASVCSVTGRLLGKPVIVKLTGYHEISGGILDAHARLPSRLRRHALQQATYVQATSNRIADLLRAAGFGSAQIRRIPNAVDIDRLRPSPDGIDRTAIRGDAMRVGIYVGRLAPEKGLEHLLRSWKDALAGRRDIRLVLVGDGPLRGPLEKMARDLQIHDALWFAGHADEVGRFLHAADFAILPSLSEGLSNAMLEAMASGLPMLGSRVSGTEDFVIPGETGWLFEPGDEAGLASCLAAIADTAPEALHAMGARARTAVTATASIEAVVGQLAELYGLGSFAECPRPARDAGFPERT